MAQTPIYYCPPTKLREGNVFSHVSLSARGGFPCDHYSWCIGPHCTRLLSSWTWDSTVQPPPRTWDLTTEGLPRHRTSQYSPRADIWWLRSVACGTHPTGMLFCFFTDTGQSIIVQPRFTNISDENLIQNCSFSLKYTRCQYLLR